MDCLVKLADEQVSSSEINLNFNLNSILNSILNLNSKIAIWGFVGISKEKLLMFSKEEKNH